MLEKIHSSHLGIVKYKQRARNVLFWPGMGKNIEDMISQCNTCLECQSSNPKEPLISESVPTRPWEVASTDLFTWKGEEYLLVVGSYSHYIEIAKLSNPSSKMVVMYTKSIFARHGILRIVKSDNGPQYSAQEIKNLVMNGDLNI